MDRRTGEAPGVRRGEESSKKGDVENGAGHSSVMLRKEVRQFNLPDVATRRTTSDAKALTEIARMPADRTANVLRGAAGLTTAGMLLGALGVAVKEAGLDSLSAAFYRCVIGAVGLAAWCWMTSGLEWIWRTGQRELAIAVASGVLMAANWTLFFAALAHAGIAVATIAFHVHPLLVLLLGAITSRKALPLKQGAAVGLAFIGLALAVGTPGVLSITEGWRFGVILSLLAASAYACVTLLSRAATGLPPAALALVQCSVGIPLLALFSPIAPTAISSASWGWLLVLGLVHTGVVYALMYDALPRLSTPSVALLLFVYPASAVAVDHLVYGTAVGLTQAAGLALILVAGAAARPRR